MASWTLLDHSVAPNRVYTRSMGSAELAFYWDSAFTGTADSVQQAEVQSVVGNLLFDLENLSRTWVELKNRFPLLGSRFRIIDEGTATEIVEFVVEENRLARVDEDDISILCVSSREEAYHVADKLVNGPRQLSDSLPARLYILRRADQGDHFHIFLHVAHPIYDGIANMTLLRNFLDILTSPSNTIVTNLEERLQMVKALEALQPSLTLSVAKQRWKRAIGHVICSMKTATTKGGHTIPRAVTARTPFTPARSCMASVSLPKEISKQIVSNCRGNRITFGNALPVLGQVALTRVLYRRYLLGTISEAEWEQRRREPMHICGPLNLRPFLNRDWFDRGGASEVCLSIGFFFYTLPFMPCGLNSMGRSEVPSYSELLSSERFILRSNIIKTQAEAYLKHPLFLAINAARTEPRAQRNKITFQHWDHLKDLEPTADIFDALENGGSYLTPDLIYAHGGSSMGNIDSILPLEYPIGPSHSLPPAFAIFHAAKAPLVVNRAPNPNEITKPILYLKSSRSVLRCRPGELYLGASTSNGHLHFKFLWDGNVFEDETIHEWLNEVKDAATWYLGQE